MRRALRWFWFFFSFLTILALFAMAVGYLRLGHAAIMAVYNGEATGLLSRVHISGTLPLEYYLERADWLAAEAMLLLLVIYLLLAISLFPQFFRLFRLRMQAAQGHSLLLGFGILALVLLLPLPFNALILLKLTFLWLALLLLGLGLPQTRFWGMGRLAAITLLITLATYILYVFSGHTEQLIYTFDEDAFFEVLQTLLIFASGIFLLLRFFRPIEGQPRNIWYLLMALFFLLFAAEEVSWGQRIFGFATPETWDNVQNETTLHNLRGVDHNTLLNVLVALWALVLPLLNDAFSDFRRLLGYLRFPVMPLTSVAATCLGLIIYFMDPQNIYVDEIRELFFALAFVFFALEAFQPMKRKEFKAKTSEEPRSFSVVQVGEGSKPERRNLG